jgi:hypothetical protein
MRLDEVIYKDNNVQFGFKVWFFFGKGQTLSPQMSIHLSQSSV